MNELCADIGYKSVNHVGEQLCGDHVDVVEQSEDSTVVVLADGLGSGVKASILSTLTSKIISTMMAEGLTLESTLGTESPEGELIEKIALREAIDSLPEREQKTILLRFFKGLTQEQTARILGVSQVQVSRLERRGLAALRRLLDG